MGCPRNRLELDLLWPAERPAAFSEDDAPLRPPSLQPTWALAYFYPWTGAELPTDALSPPAGPSWRMDFVTFIHLLQLASSNEAEGTDTEERGEPVLTRARQGSLGAWGLQSGDNELLLWGLMPRKDGAKGEKNKGLLPISLHVTLRKPEAVSLLRCLPSTQSPGLGHETHSPHLQPTVLSSDHLSVKHTSPSSVRGVCMTQASSW